MFIALFQTTNHGEFNATYYACIMCDTLNHTGIGELFMIDVLLFMFIVALYDTKIIMGTFGNS